MGFSLYCNLRFLHAPFNTFPCAQFAIRRWVPLKAYCEWIVVVEYVSDGFGYFGMWQKLVPFATSSRLRNRLFLIVCALTSFFSLRRALWLKRGVANWCVCRFIYQPTDLSVVVTAFVKRRCISGQVLRPFSRQCSPTITTDKLCKLSVSWRIYYFSISLFLFALLVSEAFISSG